MGWYDFFYYTLLKHGKIIITIMGVIIAIFIFMYMQKFGAGYRSVMDNSISYCKEDDDCFEYCGKCVSIAGTKPCQLNNTVICACTKNKCKVSGIS